MRDIIIIIAHYFSKIILKSNIDLFSKIFHVSKKNKICMYVHVYICMYQVESKMLFLPTWKNCKNHSRIVVVWDHHSVDRIKSQKYKSKRYIQ